MQRAGEFLGRAVRRLDDPAAALAWLTAAWSEIAGAALAAHTRPLRCEKQRLEIATDGNVWRKQLEGMTQEFCARINHAWGATLVRAVNLVEDPSAARPALSPAEDNARTPFVRRRKPV
ncbi:MAG TPA: DciA family protein [Candidatus Acidoferrum sp.]|nr:DciA family protein [Candidatus Acidoferrum sp.]